jgi:hypothetical protein
VATDLFEPELMQGPVNRQHADPIARQVRIRRPENERLVPLVGAVVEEGRRLCIGPSNDDARHAHHVELQAGRVEPLVLLVLAHQDLACLVPALLGARLLVLDVIAGNSDLDESTNQIPDVRVPAMSRIGVRNDERAEVDGLGCLALFLGHPGASEVLVLVGGEQRPHQAGCFVGNLAEWVAGEVRTGILRLRALRRRGPPTEIDGFDPQPLQDHRLAGRIRAEGRDLLAAREQLAESGVESFRRGSGDGVVRLDRALLRGHFTGRMQAHHAVEPGLGEPLASRRDLRLVLAHRNLRELQSSTPWVPRRRCGR